jgi:hypothetical protein
MSQKLSSMGKYVPVSIGSICVVFLSVQVTRCFHDSNIMKTEVMSISMFVLFHIHLICEDIHSSKV